jgi:hypothetical protein
LLGEYFRVELLGAVESGPFVWPPVCNTQAGHDEVIDWMTFYNHRRIHSTLGYVSPMQFQKSWHAAQQLKAA